MRGSFEYPASEYALVAGIPLATSSANRSCRTLSFRGVCGRLAACFGFAAFFAARFGLVAVDGDFMA
jgi:hypothetical protein